MTTSKYLLLILCTAVFLSQAQGKVRPNKNQKKSQAFMTGQDILNRAFSNITITNRANASIRSSGLYIAAYDVNDCSVCYGNIVSGNNVMGTLVEPVLFQADQTVPIGQNYLYNVIYNGIYVVKNTIASPCALPGCSWPGDDPTIQGWCLSIGLMSRHASYTSSTYINGSNSPANVVPLSQAVTSIPFGYNYDLIDPTTLGVGEACLGPVVCDDQTLTCSVSTPQNQTFQAY